MPVWKLCSKPLQRTVLCGLPARSDERGSRRAKTTLPEDATATGTPAIRENVRPVRFWFSALDRRAADPRAAHAAVCARSFQCDPAGTARRRKNSSGGGPGGNVDSVRTGRVLHDRSRSGDGSGASLPRRTTGSPVANLSRPESPHHRRDGISAARRSGRDDFLPVDQRPLRTRKHHSHFQQELRRMGLHLRRSNHRDCDPRPPAPSFNDGEHPRRKLPAERTPQSRADSASGSTTARIFCCRPDRSRQTEPFVMSFLRHRQIYQSDVLLASERRRDPCRLRPRSHRLDEFAASYSLAGWSPPEPTSASPAGSIFNLPAETVNLHLRQVDYFSTGRMGNFQPVLTDAVQSSLADTSGDAFLTVINPAGSGLVYSSYIGGGGADQALAVAVDQTGDVYIAGQTASFNFPISAGPFQPTLIGSGDIFVTKFPLGTTQTLAVTSIAPSFGGNTGTTSPQIFGTGFHAGATAQLNCPSTMTATNVTVGPGGRMINATFNLT